MKPFCTPGSPASPARPELSRTPYLWLKNASNLNRSQQRHLDQLLLGQSHLQTVKAYQMRLAFQDFWGRPASEAERLLDARCSWARGSDLGPMALARGYRSIRNLIAIIYLMRGKLPLHQPT